jgi:hypothetical protein
LPVAGCRLPRRAGAAHDAPRPGLRQGRCRCQRRHRPRGDLGRGDMFVVIKFAGIARQYDIRGLLAKFSPGTSVLEIDPLAVPVNCRWDNWERVRRICGTITAAAPSQVALVAYCSGSSLVSQVADALASVGVCVTGHAVLDPVTVTSAVIYDELRQIAESLGRNISPEDYEALHLYHSDRCDTSRAENILRSWTNDFASIALGPPAMADPLFNELAERYISWVSFLCTAAWGNEGISRSSVIFTSEERLSEAGDSGIFPNDGLHSYATQGASCLSADQCILDFGNWCKSAMGK